MKKRLLIMTTLLSVIGVTGSHAQQDYYDLTDYYLRNAGFDAHFDYDASATGNVAQEIKAVDGWTKGFTMDYTITGTYQFGTAITFNGAHIPATGSDGTTTGGCLALSTGWDMTMVLTQDVTLPAGVYRLEAPVYNCGDKTVGTSRLGWLPTGKTAVYSTLTSYPTGEWLSDVVTFTLTEPTKGKIQVGYKAGSNGSANSAKLAIDYVKLLRNTAYGKPDVDGRKAELAEVIATAQTLYGDGNGNEAAALQAAIATAQQMMANEEATMEQVEAAIEALNQAIDDYGWANPTGAVPRVTTNARYARGATMAFGRLTVQGTGITERGFCWSESPEPTIHDNRTTTTVTNNGVIYWLQDLKPATKYYMRAYAITSGKQVGYGEVIKFYTIPKGQITFTMRSGDAANTERIRAAAETAINWWNNLTEMKGYSPNIGYNSGTPTAECSYGGYMSVGSNTSYQRPGTIMHEMLHGCGVIPWADTEWSRHNLRASVNGDGYGTGLWLGDRVTEVVRFLENSNTASLNGDYQHMWPYGVNGASEDTGADGLYIGNGLVCQALGEDGLQHTRALFAEPYYALDQEDDVKYYIKNEDESRGLYTSYLIVGAGGTLRWKAMTAAEAAANDSAAWRITFTPTNQYYQLQNIGSGRYMTYGSSFTTVSRTTPSSSEDFHLMRGRVDVGGERGYWIIHPSGNWTPPCLQGNANGLTGSATFNIANSATTQRWLILTATQAQQQEATALAALKASVTDALKPVKLLAEVPHTENEAGADQAFSAALQDFEQRLNGTPTTSDLQDMVSEVQQAACDFLSKVSPSDIAHPFDLTYMIKNAGLDAADGWAQAPTINYSCGEFYQTTFNCYQTLPLMPTGTYQLFMQGFQRPGAASTAYNDYAAGNNKVNAELYAGAQSIKVAHIAKDAQSRNVGGSESTVGSSMHIPNDMNAAYLYFRKGFYDNCLTTTIADSGNSLRMGVRSTSMPAGYWCCFDNFRLYFYGQHTAEEVTPVKPVIASSEASSSLSSPAIYSIDGRLVRQGGQGTEGLRPGLYIIGGHKVVIR